jgi:hypothetical protein
MPKYVASTTPAGPDAERTRFRRPLGVAVMAYKAVLGLSEIVVGVLLILFGLAKLVAAAAMWEGQEWGGYLLAANAAALVVLVLLIAPRGRRTGRPRDGAVTWSRGGR